MKKNDVRAMENRLCLRRKVTVKMIMGINCYCAGWMVVVTR